MRRVADRLTLTLVVLACALTLTLTAVPADAAELVMFEREGCPYCARFNREIAPIYERTDEGESSTPYAGSIFTRQFRPT